MKKAENIMIIGKADGPTSIFLAGKVHGGKRNYPATDSCNRF